MAADEWLLVKEATLAASSLRIERDNLKHIRPIFDRRLVTDIEALDVAAYQKARLAENASPKTINLEVGTIRAILRRNKVWGEIQQDVRMLPVRDDIGRAITVEEEEVLLRSCLESRSRCLYPAVVLALNSGMRYGEIRLLQWKQIDFARRTLIVSRSKTENGAGRTIPLNGRVLAVLQMWAARFPQCRPEHYVFPSEKYGAGTDTFRPCSYATDPTRPINDWKEAWEGAKKRAASILTQGRQEGSTEPARVPFQCRFHDLRHTVCTRLLEGGVPYPVVATIMGWSAATAIRMAKRYGHIGQKSMRDAMEVLGRAELEYPKNSPKSASPETDVLN